MIEKIKNLFVKEEVIPWKRDLIRKIENEMSIFELMPSSSVRNNQTYLLANVIASLYQEPSTLRSWFSKGSILTVKSPYRCNFRIIMKSGDIGFYLIIPKERSEEILRKVEGVYNSNITVNKVEELPKLNPEYTFCTELHYKKHDIFSLDTDRSNNYPLPSLLTAVRTLEGQDVAVFDAMFEPGNRSIWNKQSQKAHCILENGTIPHVGIGGQVVSFLNRAFQQLRNEIIETTRIGKKQKEQFKKWKKEQGTYKEASRMRLEMTNATKKKMDSEILKGYYRIAVQSKNTDRAKSAAYAMANAFKDVSGDNELERIDITPKWTPKYIKAIEESKPFSIKLRPMMLSCEESGKAMQLPGDALIKEFDEINSKKLIDVQIPEELTQNVKGVRLGTVTERGIKKQVKIPLEAYKGVQLKHVFDALCTSSFGQGKQGTGKSEGYGTMWAYDFIVNGLSALIIDTADGQMLRNLINSLPEDYPDEKIHCLNFDNKAWPIATNWSDVYGRTFVNGDAELQALEISERITDKFTDFINQLSSTGEFTDRMSQYVNSCMRAITTRKTWAFLDLELALTSPAYRNQLLKLPAVREMPDVVRDLNTLQSKSIENKVGQIVDPIMSRIKTLGGTQFLANLFYQEPKLNEEGKPILDLRKIMDNEQGGYGHIVAIQASSDSWNNHQATILGFMLDKINFNAFSRVDIDQSKRKPCLIWIDEPHKVIKQMEQRLAGTSVEFRKYRVKNLFTGHSIDQMGAAANALLDGGAQVTSYKTERLNQFTRFGHNFKPYDDAKALYEALPEKWRAINCVRLPSGKTCPAFLADMTPPPKLVKDRAYIWQQCAQRYGRPWREVRDEIQAKRSKYQELDEEWLNMKKQEPIQKKAEKSVKLKEAKKVVNQ